MPCAPSSPTMPPHRVLSASTASTFGGGRPTLDTASPSRVPNTRANSPVNGWWYMRSLRVSYVPAEPWTRLRAARSTRVAGSSAMPSTNASTSCPCRMLVRTLLRASSGSSHASSGTGGVLTTTGTPLSLAACPTRTPSCRTSSRRLEGSLAPTSQSVRAGPNTSSIRQSTTSRSGTCPKVDRTSIRLWCTWLKSAETTSDPAGAASSIGRISSWGVKLAVRPITTARGESVISRSDVLDALAAQDRAREPDGPHPHDLGGLQAHVELVLEPHHHLHRREGVPRGRVGGAGVVVEVVHREAKSRSERVEQSVRHGWLLNAARSGDKVSPAHVRGRSSAVEPLSVPERFFARWFDGKHPWTALEKRS